MKKVLLITNIPSPYRVDLFYYMQTHIEKYEFCVLYCAQKENNRCWNVDCSKLINTTFTKSKVISIKGKYDTKYIYIPNGMQKDLTDIDPDVVIGWEYNPAAVIALLWCKCHGRKYISLTDGTLYSERKINLMQRLTRKIIIGKCDAAIASSTKAKEKLLKWGLHSEKIFISLLTVDIKKLCKVKHEPEQGRLLYVGSMIERKGLDLLISALKYVDTSFQLHIVGNGTDKEIQDLKAQIRDSNMEDSVFFCGFKEGQELLDEYRKAHIFILPTREDCFGLVLLEALCAEVPIISSKYADGAYDVIYEGKNGLLVDPYDIQQLGNTIKNVLTGKIKLDGKEDTIVSKFTFDEVSKGYINAIDYVLKGVE